jgi:hypothetical protein
MHANTLALPLADPEARKLQVKATGSLNVKDRHKGKTPIFLIKRPLSIRNPRTGFGSPHW